MNQISAFHMSIISLLLFFKCSSHAPIEDFLNPAFQIPWWLSGEESACSAERQVCSLGQEDPLEQSMATHSSILAWEILWIEKLPQYKRL